MWDKAKDAGEIECKLMAGLQRDITDPAEADAPDPDWGHGHDLVMNWWHIAPTALKLTVTT